ncbi:MAG: hypothetical protein RL757_3239 [Bacteroidota bacterium]|jgi:nicotinamidase/pyrazinamidase
MRALLLIDLQNDFCENGALEVQNAIKSVEKANELMPLFDFVVATQDWHPGNHGSFAANNPWRKPGQVIDLDGLPQILWPIHCVQNSFGAKFHKKLHVEKIDSVVRKGTDVNIDSYSGFFDNGKRKQTELNQILQQKGITELYVMGVATDYCVQFTVLDALSLGYKTFLIEDASFGVNLEPNDVNLAIENMVSHGALLAQTHDIQSLDFA